MKKAQFIAPAQAANNKDSARDAGSSLVLAEKCQSQFSDGSFFQIVNKKSLKFVSKRRSENHCHYYDPPHHNATNMGQDVRTDALK